MFQQLIPPSLLIIGIIVALLVMLETIGVYIYDFNETKRHRVQLKHPARRFRPRPSITITIVASNSQATLENCLRSVLQCRYKKVEIIIADNASTDATKRVARQIINEHPKRSIRLFAKRKSVDRTSLTTEAYKKYGQGEIVLMLSPDMCLKPDALYEVAHFFNRTPEAQVARPAVAIAANYQLLGVLQLYHAYLRQRRQKALQSFRMTQAAPMLWRREAFLQPVPTRTYYAHAVTVVQQNHGLRPIIRQRPTLRLWQVASIIVPPIVSSYFVYTAIRLHQPALLLVCLAMVTIWFSLAIWDNQRLSTTQKLKYTLGIPIMYGPLYIYTVLRLFSIGRIRILADQ
jgi:hypothetical protein